MPIRNSSTGQFQPLSNSVADPRATEAAYGAPAVQKYRLRKEIRDADLNAGTANSTKAALAGGMAGALAGGGTVKSRAIRAGIAAAGGVIGVQAIRAATARTRDVYGDRSRPAKIAEKIPAIAGLAAAGGLAVRGARKFFDAREAACPECGSEKIVVESPAGNRRASGRCRACGHRAPGAELEPKRLAAPKDASPTKKESLLARLESQAPAPRQRREIPNAIKAGLSAGLSGAALGLIPAFRRGTGIGTVLKSVAGGAAAGAAVGGGGTYVGSKILGEPRKDEGAPITKRAALGGSVAGAVLGGAAGALALKSRTGRRLLVGASKVWRPAAWARKGGLPAAVGIGTAGGAAAGAFQGADEGQQVDTINSMQKDKARREGAMPDPKKQRAAGTAGKQFEAVLGEALSSGIPRASAVLIAARADSEGYVRYLASRGIIRHL